MQPPRSTDRMCHACRLGVFSLIMWLAFIQAKQEAPMIGDWSPRELIIQMETGVVPAWLE